jgi:hypothetical protein
MDDKYYINYLKDKIAKNDLSSSQKAYLERILRVYNMPNLTQVS